MRKVKILIPVYNDWESVSKLIDKINNLSINSEYQISVIIVNDASNHDRQDEDKILNNIHSIKVLNMKGNQGHARCIATGLKYIYEKEEFDYVIPMDGDGEDRPEEIKDFLNQIKNSYDKPIVGERIKRSENFLFKACYQIHKLITLTFTGKSIKFGNFTCLPKEHVNLLIKKPYLWNSYSSSVINTINNRTYIRSIRGSRYVLPSKMNFTALIFHSLAIISVFRNLVIIRSIAFLLLYLLLSFNNFSLFVFIPIVILLTFVLYILKISKRSNMQEFNQSLQNIGSIDILDNSNSR